MNNTAIRNILAFIFMVVLSGWIGVGVDSLFNAQHLGDSPGMGVWLALPVLTAIIIMLSTKQRWGDFGLRPNFKGNLKWYLASIMIFPIVTAIVLIIGTLSNWIDLSAFEMKTFFLVFGSTLMVNFLIDIFEEAAWRGFFTSQILKLSISDWAIYLMVGCVWALWHVPYYLVFLPEADIQAVLPVERTTYVFVAFITLLSWTVMFTELFRVTKSLWPCVLMHMVEDSLTIPLVVSGYMSIADGKQILVSPINGIITSALYIAVGLGIRAYRIRVNNIAIYKDIGIHCKSTPR